MALQVGTKIMLNALKKVFGTKNDRMVKAMGKIVAEVNAFEAEIHALSDDQLREETESFKQQMQSGSTTLDQILPRAFAVCREGAIRVLGMRHYDVQMVGGIVLHRGQIAEMKTGEGKTLTATLPVYLNALAGEGVHVVTVNDYLAKRDSEWMGKLYEFLGLTTGVIVHGLSDVQRRDAYHADVTYGTNNEFGFDFLRDNMKVDPNSMVQREPFYCIIDEVDSILIDEARTPLIIAGPAESDLDVYYTVNKTIPGLQKDSDYIVDEKSNTIGLTEDGIAKVERRLRIDNMYDPNNIRILHHVEQALKAHFLFKKDVDYVVRDGEVLIVDEFTGRLMPGRRYSDGLHGALEAKEHLKVQQETQTMASITFQNLFRMYEKLSGMTGTADTEAVEFKKIYDLDVVVIPTNKPIVREDSPDNIYRTAREKFNAIADEIADAQKKGQPVLVGTVSVEKSELLSMLLQKRSIPHEILNAKNHKREAEIVQTAGHKGRVTLSTNMAGRGTDIVLGEGVREVGGLYVIGSERHDSRRIDNQLRGRSGRQGDPGKTVFYLSLEDDLMRIFGSERLSSIMQTLGMKEGESIVSKMVTRQIEKAQKRVEERNFSSRKHVLEYDDVMNQQRQVVYRRRNDILKRGEGIEFMEEVTGDIARDLVQRHSPEMQNLEEWPVKLIEEAVEKEFNNRITIKVPEHAEPNEELLSEQVTQRLMENYKRKEEIVSLDQLKQVEKYVYLQLIDSSWKEHLYTMDRLRDSVGLRAHGQRDPLQEYKKEGYTQFSGLIGQIESDAVLAMHRMPPPEEAPVIQNTAQLDLDSLDYNNPDAELEQSRVAGGSGSVGFQAPAHQAPDESQMVMSGAGGSGAAASSVAPMVREAAKVGRNDPCPCGSGKKYKKCHGGPAGRASV